MSTSNRLVELLADGDFHSGEDLACALEITRAAVWKRIKQLEGDTGLRVDAVRGRGYRLSGSLDLLDADRVLQRLQSMDAIQRAWVLQTVDSTNSFLAQQPVPPVNRAYACLCEYQRSGRGRRGRTWLAGFGANLTLSVGWQFDLPLSALAGLSLAVGVALAEMLWGLGLRRHRLKWPNDIHVDDEKLAGILVEAFGEAQGPAYAVIGVGLNVRMPTDQIRAIDCPSTDLARQGLIGLDRSEIAVESVATLVDMCRQYAQEGLAPFLPRWHGFDGYLHRDVTLTAGTHATSGRYVGIDDAGALLLESDGQVQAFCAGEVSLRLNNRV